MKDLVSEIISRIRDEQQKIADAVTAGTNINSFNDYQQLVGNHRGLQTVLDIIDEILTEDQEDL